MSPTLLLSFFNLPGIDPDRCVYYLDADRLLQESLSTSETVTALHNILQLAPGMLLTKVNRGDAGNGCGANLWRNKNL